MTFEEWADNLDLRASFVPGYVEDTRNPWRCSGCQQLMYGTEWIDGCPYPSPLNTPAGMYIDDKHDRVCYVCWEMNHAIDSDYWKKLSVAANKFRDGLRPGGNYLAT